jgi:hypothetical protein
MLPFLVMAITAAAASVDIIRIRFTPDGAPMMRNRIPQSLLGNDTTFDLLFGIGSDCSMIGSDCSSYEQITFFRDEISTWCNITSCLPGAPVRTVPISNPAVTVGIGPGSHLVQTYGEVSIVKNYTSNSGLLMLGESTHFNQSCVPGTISRIPVEHGPDGYRVGIEYRLNFPHSEVDAIVENPFIPPSLSGDLSMLILPTILSSAFRGFFSAFQVTSDSGRQVLTDCDPNTVFQGLPTLTLTLSAARIVLYPEDYMDFNSDRNECEFRLPMYSIDDHPVLEFNPLLIPFVNVKITNQEIFICDTI